ncbi:hypothetical protein ABW21_db0206047 [Orbilia brochopaga]|nr:hypothetical protein ABW21_db0206047 [Drechslerella brochopaga]
MEEKVTMEKKGPPRQPNPRLPIPGYMEQRHEQHKAYVLANLPIRPAQRTPPPPPTLEERRARKIEFLKESIEEIEARKGQILSMPDNYTKSLQTALSAWENREVEWADDHAFLWGPKGLVAEGTVDEMWDLLCRYAAEDFREYHFDPGLCTSAVNAIPTPLDFLFDTGTDVGLIYDQDVVNSGLPIIGWTNVVLAGVYGHGVSPPAPTSVSAMHPETSVKTLLTV